MTDEVLVPTERLDDTTWQLEVTRALANPLGVLYGGAPLALSVELAEEVVGAPARWGTTRFLHGAAIGDTLRVEVRVDVAGRRTSHVHVTGASDSGVVFETMLGVGTGKEDGLSRQWLEMPDVTHWSELPEPPARPEPMRDTAVARGDRRMAVGPMIGDGVQHDTGNICIWAHLPGVDTSSRPSLAWLADCMGLAVAAAYPGRVMPGTSLDNTIRFNRSVPSEWILMEVYAEAIHNGYGYGTVHQWAEDGTLLATGTQTAIFREGEFFPGR